MEKTKTCSKCKEAKSVLEYHKNNRTKDGLRSQCKLCSKQYYLQWIKNNKKHKADYDKKYRLYNQEAVVERDRRYRLNNKEKIAEYKQQYYQDNKASISEKQRLYRQEHRDKIQEYHKQYHKNYIQQPEVRMRKAENDRKRNARLRGNIVGVVPNNIKELLYKQDVVCGICRNDEQVEWSDVHIDHIFPIDRNGHHAVYNLQVSHSSCNESKRNKFEFELPIYTNSQRQVMFPALLIGE